jgi:hypothetical protein
MHFLSFYIRQLQQKSEKKYDKVELSADDSLKAKLLPKTFGYGQVQIQPQILFRQSQSKTDELGKV